MHFIKHIFIQNHVPPMLKLLDDLLPAHCPETVALRKSYAAAGQPHSQNAGYHKVAMTLENSLKIRINSHHWGH